MYIYKITNSDNGKVYIGQTIRPIEQRFKRHIYDALNNVIDTHFARAIRKYGKEKFYIECIDTAITQDELTEKEYFWINYYNSCDSKFGYNETDSKLKCGGNTYRVKSKPELKNITEKIRETKLGDKNPNAASVKCLNIETNTELIFNTVKSCQEYFGEKTHRFITTRVNHQVKSLYKNIWAIAYTSDEYSFEKEVHKTGNKLVVYDKQTNAFQIFNSIRLCSRVLTINRITLNSSLKQVQKFENDKYIITKLN